MDFIDKKNGNYGNYLEKSDYHHIKSSDDYYGNLFYYHKKLDWRNERHGSDEQKGVNEYAITDESRMRFFPFYNLYGEIKPNSLKIYDENGVNIDKSKYEFIEYKSIIKFLDLELINTKLKFEYTRIPENYKKMKLFPNIQTNNLESPEIFNILKNHWKFGLRILHFELNEEKLKFRNELAFNQSIQLSIYGYSVSHKRGFAKLRHGSGAGIPFPFEKPNCLEFVIL